jgi:hypothetical protein
MIAGFQCKNPPAWALSGGCTIKYKFFTGQPIKFLSEKVPDRRSHQRLHHWIYHSCYQQQGDEWPVDVLPFVVFSSDRINGVIHCREEEKDKGKKDG